MQTYLRTYRSTYIFAYVHTYLHAYIAVRYITWPYLALPSDTFHSITLHDMTLHCYMPFHSITLHYITLHPYIHTHTISYIHSTYTHIDTKTRKTNRRVFAKEWQMARWLVNIDRDQQLEMATMPIDIRVRGYEPITTRKKDRPIKIKFKCWYNNSNSDKIWGNMFPSASSV